NAGTVNYQVICENNGNNKEETDLKGNQEKDHEPKDSWKKHTEFYQSLATLLHVASVLGINVIGIKHGTICICPYRASAAVVALVVVTLSLVMSLGIIFSIDASYQQKVLILPLFSANCFCCYTQVFWLIKSRRIANFLVEVEACKLRINRSYPVKVAVGYSFCYSIIYTVFVYQMVHLPDHIFAFPNTNLEYMLTFPVFVTCFIPSMFDLYIFTFTLFLIVALERLQEEVQAVQVWSKEEINAVAKKWLRCRNLLDMFSGVFSYLLHVRMLLYVMHAIAHLFALTSMKLTRDCAFYFWPLMLSLLENSVRYLGVCQTGQHLTNTHGLVVKKVRDVLLKQCLHDAEEENSEEDDTSSWLFIKYEMEKPVDLTRSQYGTLGESVVGKSSEKNCFLTEGTARHKSAAVAESAASEAMTVEKLNFNGSAGNETEEGLMEMEVKCSPDYEENDLPRNSFLEEIQEEENFPVKEVTNEGTPEKSQAKISENMPLKLDRIYAHVVPDEILRNCPDNTKTFEDNSKTEVCCSASNSKLEYTEQVYKTSGGTQSDNQCCMGTKAVYEKVNQIDVGNVLEIGLTHDTILPSGKALSGNGSIQKQEKMRIIDHMAYQRHDLQNQKSLSGCNAPYPRVLVSDLKKTQFAGIEPRITALTDDTAHASRQDNTQTRTPIAQNFACRNGKHTSQKEAVLAEEQICEVLCNAEQVGDLCETEIPRGNYDNTELEETALEDGVTCEDKEMAEPRETGIGNELTSNNNGDVTRMEVLFANKVTSAEDGTWKDNETLRQTESFLTHEVPCEDRDTRQMEAFLAVDVIYEHSSETEEKDTLCVYKMAGKGHENTGGNKACFGDKLIVEDVKANGRKETFAADAEYFEDENKSKKGPLCADKVTYENNSTRQTDTSLVDEATPRNSKKSRQCEELITTRETSEGSKDIRPNEAFLSDERKCGDETEVRPMEVNFVEEGGCEHEIDLSSDGIIVAEECTCKDEYSWQEESYPADDTIRESDQDLSQKETLPSGKIICKNYQALGQAQATLSDKELFESNQSLTNSGTSITDDAVCEKDDAKLQETFLVDKIARANSQLLKKERFLHASIKCEELPADGGHISSIKTHFSCLQSLDEVLEVGHCSVSVETALDSSDISKETLNANTSLKEAAGSERHNFGENDTEFNQRVSTENEVRECPENTTTEKKESTKTGPLDRLCLERFLCHLEEFPFSADVWGAHPLGASSYVTCLGIVVTYLLMLLQLQPILSDASADQDLDSLLENDQGIFECLSK
ncbi:uncharacterized protein LOC135198276, partial [Macrobrachium nipponense]|uniref:uncharacterized protein LOC135198276 n=1 Tax=Macrobrachium nipponense TaxID=159736 RepID=UPI0030C7A313